MEQAKVAFLNTLPAGGTAIWFETDMLFTCRDPGSIFAGVPDSAALAMTFRHEGTGNCTTRYQCPNLMVNSGLMLMRNTDAVRALHQRHAAELLVPNASTVGGQNQVLLDNEFGRIPYNTMRTAHGVPVFSVDMHKHILGDLNRVARTSRQSKVLSALTHPVDSPRCVIHFNGVSEYKSLMLWAVSNSSKR